MLPIIKTHTSDAFVDFAYDLVEFAVAQFRFDWVRSVDYKRRSPKIFREWFGEIVIIFRNRNYIQDFEQKFCLVNELESTEDILVYFADLRDDIFKGNIPLMELISYCAFLVDIALICLQLEDPYLIYDMVDDTADVFRKHIEPYFTIVGGWHALYSVGVQYWQYVKFEPGNINPAVPVTEDFVLNEPINTGKF